MISKDYDIIDHNNNLDIFQIQSIISNIIVKNDIFHVNFIALICLRNVSTNNGKAGQRCLAKDIS